MMSGVDDGWCLVVPVKRLAAAKTRLSELAGERRPELALAFALDTTEAALGCADVRAVVVVTDDGVAARSLSAIGAVVVADVPDAGLNPALRYGAQRASDLHPGCGVGALSADLPALRPDELARALHVAAGTTSGYVPDPTGHGTTLLLARRLADFRPAFGVGSAAAHRAAGAVEIDVPGLDSIRRDVDTPADLMAAKRLGLRPRTRALVAGLRAGQGAGG